MSSSLALLWRANLSLMVLYAVVLFSTARTRNTKTNPYAVLSTLTTKCSLYFLQLVPPSINLSIRHTIKARCCAERWG